MVLSSIISPVVRLSLATEIAVLTVDAVLTIHPLRKIELRIRVDKSNVFFIID